MAKRFHPHWTRNVSGDFTVLNQVLVAGLNTACTFKSRVKLPRYGSIREKEQLLLVANSEWFGVKWAEDFRIVFRAKAGES